jgi:hypothetical protein
MNTPTEKLEDWHVLGSSQKYLETKNKNAPVDLSKLPLPTFSPNQSRSSSSLEQTTKSNQSEEM